MYVERERERCTCISLSSGGSEERRGKNKRNNQQSCRNVRASYFEIRESLERDCCLYNSEGRSELDRSGRFCWTDIQGGNGFFGGLNLRGYL